MYNLNQHDCDREETTQYTQHRLQYMHCVARITRIIENVIKVLAVERKEIK